MARFLVDEDLARSVVRELTAAGHDADDVHGVGLQGASDDEVHACAVEQRRTLVTGDLGLANPFRYPAEYGTVLVRLPSTTPAPELARRVASAIAAVTGGFAKRVVVIEPGRVRIRDV